MSHGIRGEFLPKSSSGTWSIERGWGVMQGYPAMRNHTNCMYPWTLSRVREQPHKLRRTMNAPHHCMGPRARDDRVCILYHEMMSNYSRVTQKYTLCCWLHLHCSCISGCPMSASVIQVFPYGHACLSLPNWMAAVVRNRYSFHNGLQLHF